MKKKVKKIPKYSDGTEEVEDVSAIKQKKTPKPYVDGFSFSNSIGEHWNNMDSSAKASAIAGGIGGIGNMISNATSGKDVTFGGVVSGIGQGAATGGAIGGPWGAVIGGAVGGLASAMGRTNGVNYATRSTNINDIKEEGSGILSWFGMSDAEMMQKANLVQNSNIGEVQTQQKRAEYAMNPNNPNGGKVMAAEGGIMRKPVDALVSKGELIYDPTTNKLRQVPGSKGKPNKADDVFARLYEGDVVISNSPTMLMANGKTPAQNLMGMVDKYATGGTVKAREAIIKKVVNWQEANKTKPQEYAMYNGGGWVTENGVKKHITKNSMGKPIYSQSGEPYLGDVKAITWNDNVANKGRYKVEKDLYGGELDEVVVTAPKINKASSKNDAGKKSSSGKTTATTPQESKLTPEQIAESLRIEDIGERHWLRGPVTVPKQSLASLAQISPEQIKLQGVGKAAPLNGIKPLQQQDVDGEITAPNGSNWRDGLYRMAVLSQPLWDRAKAEPVNYESPVYKYMPTQIDVSSQFRDADQSYALSRYNFANLYPNTGAGMAAGLQAASNRAKQYADIRQWQTNAQNELIGKNVGIYNNWANEHARILNDVYNKSAQNRAAARNINRQNRATALSNLGTMLSDDKKMAMDKLRLQTIEPMLQYAYQNYVNYLKWKKSNGYE